MNLRTILTFTRQLKFIQNISYLRLLLGGKVSRIEFYFDVLE